MERSKTAITTALQEFLLRLLSVWGDGGHLGLNIDVWKTSKITEEERWLREETAEGRNEFYIAVTAFIKFP